jgi:hypothetical protein
MTSSGRRPWWRVWRKELVVGAVVAGLIVVGVVDEQPAEQQDSRCRLPGMNPWYDACYEAEQESKGQ